MATMEVGQSCYMDRDAAMLSGDFRTRGLFASLAEVVQACIVAEAVAFLACAWIQNIVPQTEAMRLSSVVDRAKFRKAAAFEAKLQSSVASQFL